MPVGAKEAESLGQRVRRLRVAYGLSQEELAHDVGVSKTQVYLVESGKTRSPHGEVLRGYARALRVSVSYLTSGVEEEVVDNAEPWPPLEVHLRRASTLSDDDIGTIVRIVQALEKEQRLDMARRREARAQSPDLLAGG